MATSTKSQRAAGRAARRGNDIEEMISMDEDKGATTRLARAELPKGSIAHQRVLLPLRQDQGELNDPRIERRVLPRQPRVPSRRS